LLAIVTVGVGAAANVAAKAPRLARLAVEIESEPSFYLFADKFDRKIGSKSNVLGIEGFL
jgi:hypothetical protein